MAPKRDPVQQLMRQLTQELRRNTEALTNLYGSTEEVKDSIDESRIGFRGGRTEEYDRPVRAPGTYQGDVVHDIHSGNVEAEGDIEDPLEVGGTQRQRRRRRDPVTGQEPPRTPPPPSVRTASSADDDPDEEEPEQARISHTPEQEKLRGRAHIISSREDQFGNRLWFGKPSAQQMAFVGQSQFAKWAFETQPDPDNPEVTIPTYLHPDDIGNVARDDSGRIVRNEEGNVLLQSGEPARMLDASSGGVPLLKTGGALGGLRGGISKGFLGASGLLGTVAETMPEGFAALAAIRAVHQGLDLVATPGRAGLQMGYEPGFHGEGARNFLGGIRDIVGESFGGWNPWLSVSQAAHINSTIQGYGYRGDQRSQIFHGFAGLAEQQGLNVDDYGQLFNNDFRYGATNISEFVRTMQQVPAAAQAANLSVSGFTQQLSQVSAQIAERSGTSATNVAGQITAISTATGLSPALAGAQYNDDFNTILGAARSGERLGTYLADPNRAVYAGSGAIEDKFRIATGHDIKELPTNPDLQALVREINYTNPQLLGLNFQQLMQYALDPTRKSTLTATSDVADINKNLLQGTGGRSLLVQDNQLVDLSNSTNRANLDQRLSSDLERAGVGQSSIDSIISKYGGDAHTSIGDIQQEIRKVNRAIADKTGGRIQNANAKASVLVNLDPRARGILTAVLQNTDLEQINQPNNGNTPWYDTGVAGSIKDSFGVSGIDLVESGLGFLG